MVKHIQKKQFLLLAAISMTALSVGIYYRAHTSTDPKRYAQLELARVRGVCAKQTDRTKFIACFRTMIAKAVGTVGVSAFMEALADEYISEGSSGSAVVTSCHDIAHSLGQMASTLGDPRRALSSCNSVCGAGCYHGVVEGFIASGKTVTDLTTTLCTDMSDPALVRARWACFHGLGHGIASIKGSVPASLALCDGIVEEDDKKNCDRGVFMELMQSSSFEHAKVPVPADIPAFCETLGGIHARVCYENAGLTEYTKSKSAQDALNTCEHVPAAVYADCITLLGNMIFHESNNDVAKIIAFCNESSHANWCITGAVHESVLSDPLVRTGITLCASAPVSFQNECFAYLGERAEAIYGQEKHVMICETAPEVYKKVCLGDRTLP